MRPWRTAILFSACREIQYVLSEFSPIKIHRTETLRNQDALMIRDECSRGTTQAILRKYDRFCIKRDRHRVVVLREEWR
jgi:hypothetical protein